MLTLQFYLNLFWLENLENIWKNDQILPFLFCQKQPSERCLLPKLFGGHFLRKVFPNLEFLPWVIGFFSWGMSFKVLEFFKLPKKACAKDLFLLCRANMETFWKVLNILTLLPSGRNPSLSERWKPWARRRRRRWGKMPAAPPTPRKRTQPHQGYRLEPQSEIEDISKQTCKHIWFRGGGGLCRLFRLDYITHIYKMIKFENTLKGNSLNLSLLTTTR